VINRVAPGLHNTYGPRASHESFSNCRKCGKIPTSDNLIVNPEFLLNLNKIRISYELEQNLCNEM